ncbi:MAG: RluA family pseudouridine synthase [Clostridia bacterium]|nr:RluA family pseudouridine synthase [Clostridia bacterium]
MEWLVDTAGHQKSLSDYLRIAVDDVPLRIIRDVIRTRNAKVDDIRITGDPILKAGQKLTVYWPKTYLQTLNTCMPPIVYEDEHILVIDKPYGLMSQSESSHAVGNNALDLIRNALNQREIPPETCVLCHRLDVMTGGLLLFAKDADSAEAGLSAFENRDIEKIYTCDVKGCPAQAHAVLEAWLRKDERAAQVSVTDYPAHGAVPIKTGYRILKSGENARLEVELFTGRTHQIRAHLAHIGHPILGDDKYGDRMLNRRLGLRHQLLWATRMTFHTSGILAYLNGKSVETVYPYGKQTDCGG